jgi:RNA polymerase sigma-70 factor, ECF subfamily
MTISPPETRASLILRLQDAEDIVAWDEFAEVYSPVVYRAARRMGLQSTDADDVVQEVLSAVAVSVAKWIHRDDRGPFRAWLFRIARNTAINFLTRRQHRPWAEGGNAAIRDFGEAAAVDVSSHFDLEYRREVFARASEQVQMRVNNSTWQSFYRTSVLHESIEQVAKELDVSVGSVYIARSRVMKQLQCIVRSLCESSDHEV